ncbi:hypothetical protein DFH08DRAFT_811607 [Mycena albidolilacea]|uniref:Uncharacterized protein n=1 Tax=Mycena albidolilacea TaxID=1033008 RepID=A0AAD6ZWN6_9AGAR|nr:hypothetical protein DFH08DRAFT_811607 [Mycena albidolilacea]
MPLTLYTLRSDRAASTLNHRYGDRRTLPGSSSYCFPETQIHEESVCPLLHPCYAADAPASQPDSVSKLLGNYGYPEPIQPHAEDGPVRLFPGVYGPSPSHIVQFVGPYKIKLNN